jgi:putative phosphoribosyl transferase
MDAPRENEVVIPLDGERHAGTLDLPPGASGLVVFAHGSGSSRLSPRNRHVARIIQRQGIATLLFDLLTSREDEVYETRFDIRLLTSRLIQATRWALAEPATRALAIGYFGASTGAAAALMAAAALPHAVRAVVSRGGRPDLAMDALERVQAPTLLIVGGHDDVVIELNRTAYAHLTAEKALHIVPGATHLFEEPGTLDEVGRVAAGWFASHLSSVGAAAR